MATAPRRVHQASDLHRLFDPRSVAIMGISERPGSFGQDTLRNLQSFEGPVYLVNAKYPKIGDRPCYTSLAALPEVPDCVVVVSGRESVDAMVSECAEHGVGGVVIYAAGYAETGLPERVALQQKLMQYGRSHGMHVLGPNCIGFINFSQRLAMSFTAAEHFPLARAHAIGLVSQSGALGLAQMLATRRGVSFSHILSCGNSAGVDVADCVSYLADQPGCAAIACIFEGMPEPRRFLEAAQRAGNSGKQLVVYKLGTSDAGSAAALSHTGSLAGSMATYRAAIEGVGGVLVHGLESLLETACFFAKAGHPKASGVAVIATSGGAAIIAADKAQAYGVDLPQPEPDIKAAIKARIPEFGSANNPCDVTAQVKGDPHLVRDCAAMLLGHPAYGALVHPQAFSNARSKERLLALGQLGREHGKIVCVPWLCGWLEGPGSMEAEEDSYIALFRSTDSCFAALSAWFSRAAQRDRMATTGPCERTVPEEMAQAARKLLQSSPHKLLTERSAKAVLGLYGVPVVQERLATSLQDALLKAADLGFPVALKVDSPKIPHKTEAGVVRLGLQDAAAVGAAYEAIMANALRVALPEHIHGVLVQPMVAAGIEIIVGAHIDPGLGPTIVVGLGGVLVELLKDTVTSLAPLSHDDALQMLGRLKGSALLSGFRGNAGISRENLADVIVRLSEFAADQASDLHSMDVNPLICSEAGVIAADALIILERA